MLNRICRLFTALTALLFLACHHQTKEISFYYWRTVFRLDSAERRTLSENQVNTLHIRYFDVDWDPASGGIVPVQPIQIGPLPENTSVIPVVYFTNRSFEHISPDSIPALVQSIHSMVSGISGRNKIHAVEVQFDCDWTESTRTKYFLFLRQYKQVSGSVSSCTVRLHQVKYAARTGIPPVDYGVLMFYNMGKIGSDPSNSIYEKNVSEKYSAFIQTYPLALDLALPVFSWSLQIRDQRVISLLNKMSFTDFENLPNFIQKDNNRFIVKASCFAGGYYFRQGDEVKVEHVSKEDLEDMVDQVNRYSNQKIKNLIFYDLDSRNTKLYETNIFKKIADRTH